MKFTVSRAALVAGLMTSSFCGIAAAQTAPPQDDADTVFVLGRIENGITDSDGQTVSDSTITAEEMRKFDRASVDEAIDLIPGANASNTGGSRNEKLIFIRGFDRFQTTISIDGVRVFLPADNRIDFGRFMTSDIAEVQVSKGYVSVLNGPGGVGGAVNLVTRKPSGPLELEASVGATTDGGFEHNSSNASLFAGTQQDMFYVQGSAAWQDRDSWSLSDDFAVKNATLEDGGERGFSATSDWRVNVKAGFTPNDTDEYALAYMRQSGEKNAPLHITDINNTRFWTWPYWDLESIYFLSRTQLAPNLQLRTRAYYNTFQNLLKSYDNAAQNTQSLPRSFNSYYDDAAYGANATLEAKLVENNTLTGAFHWRRDEHNERQYGFTRVPVTGNPFVNAPYIEPWQPSKEDTFSFAVEDVHKLGAFDFVGGISYDWTNLVEASEITLNVAGTAAAPNITFSRVDFPLIDMDAINVQGAVLYHLDDNTRWHASVSSRTRFPTLMDRFSARMGAAVPNPDIEPERMTNYELGMTTDFTGGNFAAAVFYSDVKDALILTPILVTVPTTPPQTLTLRQTKNVGDGSYYGAELSFVAPFADNIDVGGNLTLINRTLNDTTGGTVPRIQPTGVPESKLFLYADWTPVPALKVTPSLELAGQRNTITVVAPLTYYETGAYTLLNLALDWTVTDNISLLLSGRNLADADYVLTDGFPEEGRNFSLSLRWRN